MIVRKNQQCKNKHKNRPCLHQHAPHTNLLKLHIFNLIILIFLALTANKHNVYLLSTFSKSLSLWQSSEQLPQSQTQSTHINRYKIKRRKIIIVREHSQTATMNCQDSYTVILAYYNLFRQILQFFFYNSYSPFL